MNQLEVRAAEATEILDRIAQRIRETIDDGRPVPACLMRQYWAAEAQAQELWRNVDDWMRQEWAQEAL